MSPEDQKPELKTGIVPEDDVLALRYIDRVIATDNRFKGMKREQALRLAKVAGNYDIIICKELEISIAELELLLDKHLIN